MSGILPLGRRRWYVRHADADKPPRPPCRTGPGAPPAVAGPLRQDAAGARSCAAADDRQPRHPPAARSTPVNPTREELPLGEYDDAGKQQWPLLYRDFYGSTEDEDGYVNWRQIAENDPEFEADYIDYNIVNATVLVTLDTGEYDAIKVHYKDGRTRTFAKDDIPNPKFTRKYKQRGQARTPLLDAFEKREEESTQDAFIYPTYKEQIVLSPYLAPNLGSIREQADELAAELAKLRQLAYVAGQFASILAMYGAVAGRPHTSRSRFVGFPGLRNRRAVTTGAMPRARPNAPQAPQGGKKSARTKPATMTLGNKKPPSRTPVKAKPTAPKSGNKKQGKVDVESGKDVGKQRETAREGGEGGEGQEEPEADRERGRGRGPARRRLRRPTTAHCCSAPATPAWATRSTARSRCSRTARRSRARTRPSATAASAPAAATSAAGATPRLTSTRRASSPPVA